MAWNDEDDSIQYKVVLNHEEQYSIWPADWENASGWKDAGKLGTKAECLAHIKEVWIDMRPLSLRKRMEELARVPIQEPTQVAGDEEGPDLVAVLSQGQHRVEAGLPVSRSAPALRERIEMGYVHIRFPDTRGGTELGMRLDTAASDLSKADFANATGKVRLVGSLTLDYVPVRCVAEIDLSTLAGTGRLEPVAGA